MRLGFVLLLAAVGGLAAAGSAAASDDCSTVAGGRARVCAFDEHSTLYNYGGTYKLDRTNTVAGASTDAAGSAAVTVGQGDHYFWNTYCNWGCTYTGSYRDGTEANATQSHEATSGRVWAGQEQGWSYRRTPSSATFWEHRTTGVYASRSVGSYDVEAGAMQTDYRKYSPSQPYTTGCETYAFARVEGREAAPRPSVACQQGPADTRVPQAYTWCSAPRDPRVCGKLPDWPDGTGLPFL